MEILVITFLLPKTVGGSNRIMAIKLHMHPVSSAQPWFVGVGDNRNAWPLHKHGSLSGKESGK